MQIKPIKLLFADRTQNLMYKNQTVQNVIQHSVSIVYLIHKQYDTFLKL
jgi:hypothetical protein